MCLLTSIWTCPNNYWVMQTRGDHCSDEWMVEEESHNSESFTSTIATTPGSSIATARDTIEMNSSSHDIELF